MNSLAKKISERLENKEITIQQVQSYEGSSSAKYDVLIALRDFYQEYDPEFTLAHLIEKDLEKENYQLPIDKVEEKLKEEKNIRKQEKVEDLRGELDRARKVIMDQAETIHYLSEKLKAYEIND